MLTDHQPSGAHGAHGAPDAARVRAIRERPLIIVGLALALLAIIAGSVWAATRAQPGATVTARATPTATASPTPTPRVVYQSNWSHGADGWTLPTGTRISDGRLEIDGGHAVEVEIPYRPKMRDYSIEMDFQIVRAELGSHFGLTARNAAGDRQYLAQMECTPMHQGAWTPAMGGCAGAVTVYARSGDNSGGFFASDYVIHSGPQRFQLEVTGDTVSFCPANDCLVPVTSGVPMDASPRLIVEDRAVRLLVTRVTVTALS